MGYKFSYDITKAVREINACVYDVNDMNNPGIICWGAKQDLYRMKWIIDNALRRCSEFGETEQQWLKEQEQKRIISILKDDIQ